MIGHVAVTTFRCVNCGAGTSLPTFLAIVFGGVGALAAAYSIRNQAREQRRLTTELTRRADFAITVALAPVVAVEHADLDSATVRTTASSINLRFQIGITNTGTLAATHTTVNFLTAVYGAGDFYWCDAEGNRLERENVSLTTSEPLGPPGATTRWLPRAVERVALKTSTLIHALLAVNVPPDGTLDVHARAKAQSDDLPDEVPERKKDFVVRIRRPDEQP